MARPTRFTWFQQAYIEAALWSSLDESTPEGGVPLDENYGYDDISDETLIEMCHESAAFEAQCQRMILNAEKTPPFASFSALMASAGHDFWLTRNGHGCGFWDGDWREPHATALAAISKAFGGYGLYVGDDGKIHGMKGCA